VKLVRRPTISLTESVVLALLVESPRHGYDIAGELRPGTELGSVWRVSRPLVYRAVERLVDLGIVEPRREEHGAGGPPRVVHGATRAGRNASRRWLATPVEHVRDVRSELLLKLVLARRAGIDTASLVDAQRATLAGPIAAFAAPTDPTNVVALWRHHSAAAVDAFLADLADPTRWGFEADDD